MTKNRRLQWYVYSDALMLDAGRTYDHRTDTQHAAIEEAAALLLQAHTELQGGLGRGSTDVDHLGRARAELSAHEKAVTKSFDHLQAALALLGDNSSAQIRTVGTGTLK